MTHEDLRAALARMHVAVDAAEAHGWLCGALCARAGYGATEWLAELAPDAGAAVDPAAVEALRALPAETIAAFRSAEFRFAPLLPVENAPLPVRVAALASWCDGFLFGIGGGTTDRALAQAGDVGEYLRDLADITRAELEPGRSADAAEGDFADLYEFVRAGAQLTFDELAGARTHAAG